MSAIAVGLKTAAVRLVAAPSAVFLAVLTAGLAASSTAQHSGLFAASMKSQPSVVLACPKTRAMSAARSSASAQPSAACRKSASQATAAQAGKDSRTVEASYELMPAEKSSDAKAGGSDASFPLPDFRTPELSRFKSPF